ncbi:MAG: signal recognition particle-docking protein FtsY [Candidatus Nanopelagicales bacterium]
MDSLGLIIAVAVALLVLVGVAVALVRRRPSRPAPPRPGIDYAPGVGDDDTVPRDTIRRPIEEAVPAEALGASTTQELDGIEADLEEIDLDELSIAELGIEQPEPAAGRLTRLRRRLARSQSTLGRGLLALMSRDTVDAATWDEVEETLLSADLGVAASTDLMERLRARVLAESPSSPEAVRALLREELIALVDPTMDRSIRTTREGEGPAVLLVVGVNGTGKTTTTGKLGRLLVAEGRTVVLGAADTFRAAAADQLQTWGDRVGAAVVRGPEGGDPAAVAFDAVRIGAEADVDTVVIDTAGRLHTKVGLMDELGKVKRVIEKQGPVDEVLLVLDATTGQNGLTQAKVFSEVVDVTGIVLTKLDGTAKGGIVVAVQRELGVPVKLVGLGEGPDDLAPFDPAEFVDALLEE